MEEDLIDLILADGAVSAIVDDRVWPGWRPQGSASPCLTVTLISDVFDYHMGGEVGLTDRRFQIDAWADTYGGAKLLARAVTDLLSGFSGVHGDTRFQAVFVNTARDLAEMEAPERLHRVSIDITIRSSAAG